MTADLTVKGNYRGVMNMGRGGFQTPNKHYKGKLK